ncbi:hypothetical protein YQE_05671, partial [Dendroctonus ponderosae]
MISLGSYFEQLLEFGSLTAAQFEPAFGRSQIYCILVSCAYYIHEQTANEIRLETTQILRKAKSPLSNLSREEQHVLKEMRRNTSVVVLPDDKRNATVVMNREEYEQKI